jgi:hypothetical protein
MQKTRKMVELESLKNASHNPPNRITKANIQSLADSMSVIGQLSPIIITLTDEIIDGHRRVAAAKFLGWSEIEANIVKDLDKNFAYGTANATSRKLSGCDALYVYLEQPDAVVRSTRLKFDEMVEVLTRPLVKKICKSGNSWRIYVNAKQVAKYVDDENPETLKAIVEWLLAFPVQRTVIQAMASGESPRTILNAITNGKAIKLKLAIV